MIIMNYDLWSRNNLISVSFVYLCEIAKQIALFTLLPESPWFDCVFMT